MEGDSVYFSRRAKEERAAALKALNPNARQIHLDLASRYEELSAAIELNERIANSDVAGAA